MYEIWFFLFTSHRDMLRQEAENAEREEVHKKGLEHDRLVGAAAAAGRALAGTLAGDAGKPPLAGAAGPIAPGGPSEVKTAGSLGSEGSDSSSPAAAAAEEREKRRNAWREAERARRHEWLKSAEHHALSDMLTMLVELHSMAQ